MLASVNSMCRLRRVVLLVALAVPGVASAQYRVHPMCSDKHGGNINLGIIFAEGVACDTGYYIEHPPRGVSLIKETQKSVRDVVIYTGNVLEAEVARLNKDLKTLADANEALKKDNQAWKTNTLDATIQSINAVPGAMAGNAELKAAVAKAVADALLNDPVFLQKVRTANN